MGTVTYWWDQASRNIRIIWPDAYYAQYIYDVTGSMTQVRENGATSGAGLLAVYAYDQLGRRTSVTRGNATSTSYGWDGASRLTSLGVNLSGTSQDATWTLGYNPAGQVVSRALSNSLYAYTGQPALEDDYTNNGLNQVTAVDSTGVYYDGRGNITNDGTSEWNYDASNRIVNGDYTGIDIGTYAYDPASRLSRITASSYDRRFLYAGAQAVGEYDSSGALIRRYVPGAGLDDYAAYTVGTTTITRDWPVTDPLGSVVGVTNGSNVATQINTYDEYGVPGTFSGRFGYAGSMYLNRAMAAPWNMRNRQYNPTLGRFMQTDPIGIAGGVNLYGYVGNDPVNMVDPWGLQTQPPPDNPGDVERRFPRCPPFCNQAYAGLPALTSLRFAANDWIDWSVDTLEDVDVCQNREPTRTESATNFIGGVGDFLMVAGALSGQPEIVAVGAVLSFGSLGVQTYIDLQQGDVSGLAGDAGSFGMSLIPGARQTGRGRALFDAGRDSAGRYLPNAAGRREAVENGSRAIQGAVGGSVGSATVTTACP